MLRPARGGAAGVVVVFAILLTIAAKAGLLGIPLALILHLMALQIRAGAACGCTAGL
jgi:hypothetical protein